MAARRTFLPDDFEYSPTVDESVEQIIERGSGRTRDVIIQMRRKDPGTEDLVRRAASAIDRRRLTLTARDLLPAEKPVFVEKRSAYRRRKLAERRVSTSAQIASSTQSAPTKEMLRDESVKSMVGLYEHNAVQEALAKTETTSEKPGFWSSNSLSVTLGKDELAAVARDVEGIAAIYPNRALNVPPTAEAHTVPDAAAEARGGTWGVRHVGALSTWGAYGTRGAGVTVGVLDTGIDPDHVDLAGKLAAWAEFDGSGNPVPGSQPHDTDEHGTHVAGTIAGGDASGRWIGVAPEARIAAALAINGARGGTDAQVLAAMDWAIDQGVDIINMSLGGFTLGPVIGEVYTEAILSALQSGIPVVIAIGNDGEQTSGSPGNDLFSLAVGATDWEDRPAGFSGGRTHALFESSFIRQSSLPIIFSKPDVSAPGVAVHSCVPGDGYKAFNGTSMATPHVSGALALLYSATNGFAGVPLDERAFLAMDLLMGSVVELGENGQDHRFGFGRIDVLRAVGAARELGF